MDTFPWPMIVEKFSSAIKEPSAKQQKLRELADKTLKFNPVDPDKPIGG